MSSEEKDPLERRFPEKGVVARLTTSTGWGLFAETHFSPGEPVFWLDLEELARSKIVLMTEAFGDCHDRSATILPGFAVCVRVEHPFWNVNHSCNGNSGFAEWGRYTGSKIPFMAHVDIYPGDQITSDYSLMTSPGEGSPEGDTWTMPGCLCGVDNCRDIISDFRNMPEALQRAAVLANAAPYGRVMAHVLEHEKDLVEILKRANAVQYQKYMDTLQQQYDLASWLRKRVGWQRTQAS